MAQVAEILPYLLFLFFITIIINFYYYLFIYYLLSLLLSLSLSLFLWKLLINNSFSKCIFPVDLKFAEVSSLLKRNDA